MTRFRYFVTRSGGICKESGDKNGEIWSPNVTVKAIDMFPIGFNAYEVHDEGKSDAREEPE